MIATTVKRLAILIAILSLIGGAGYFTLQAQVAKMARARVAEAQKAEKERDFATATRIYWEHMQVIPDDPDVTMKYADALLKIDTSPKAQAEAQQRYENILTHYGGREDVRRRLIDLKMDRGNFVSRGTGTNGADHDLKILLRDKPDDGGLLFQMGRCYQEDGDDENAATYYQKAIQDGAAQRTEASWRRAFLLRDKKLNRPTEADEVIEAMVIGDHENYEVYLARGKYLLLLAESDKFRRQSLRMGAKRDFEQAKQLAPGKPEIYIEMAKMAMTASEASGPEAAGLIVGGVVGAITKTDLAREILEEGLKKATDSAALYLELARIDWNTGKNDDAIKTLERGLNSLKSAEEQVRVRLNLADLLIYGERETGKLRLQIEELKKLGISRPSLQFLEGCYCINTKDFLKALEFLGPLETAVNRSSDARTKAIKARLKQLLAKCYRQLGDTVREQDALFGALGAQPDSTEARLRLIDSLRRQGDLEGAIKEARELVQYVPQARLGYVELLIERNAELPKPQRDWSEVTQLLADADAATPEAVERVVLRAEMLRQQDDSTAADAVLAKARSEFPKRIEIPIAQAALKASLGEFDQALGVLNHAQQQLGDGVALRLARATLWSTKKGPEAARAVTELAQNIEAFDKVDRRRLLIGLASQLFLRLQDLQRASQIWSKLAEQEPDDLDPRRQLLDLALQTDRKDEIEKNIQEIERIEGPEGLIGPLGQVLYLIWQAERADDKITREEHRARARKLLNELRSRRTNWSAIPFAFGRLEEQELARDGEALTKEETQAKEENIINSYLEAIRLGQRDSAVVRRTVQLLLKHRRSSDAHKLLESISVRSQLAGDLGRLSAQLALEEQDFTRAEEIARKAVEAHPEVFSEWLWLVQILLNSDRRDEAEKELRKAIDYAPEDPERRIALVRLMSITNQLEKAIDAVREAEAKLTELPQSQRPLALAECCALVAHAFDLGHKESDKQKWNEDAKKWYLKAQNEQPGNVSITRRLAEFFVQTKQFNEADSQLEAILKHGTDVKSAETVKWAKRTRALVLAVGADKQRVSKALSLFEPDGQPAAIGSEGRNLEDPEDLRVLARVLGEQNNAEQRERAIEILESLATGNLSNPEDRLLLALLYDFSGKWEKAREAFRELNLRTKNPRDFPALNRRLDYLTHFVMGLLRHRKSGEEQDLAEAQKMVEEIARVYPDSLKTLVLQVDVVSARGQLESAADLVQAFADRRRDKLPPDQLALLAKRAENLRRLELAGQLYRQYEKLVGPPLGNRTLALFLGRCGSVKDALDLCEPLWANPSYVEEVAGVCISVLNDGHKKPDPTQLARVTGWFERAVKQAQQQNQRSTIPLLIGLGNLREQHGEYDVARGHYQEVVKLSDRNGIGPSRAEIAVAHNNIAWLIVLQDRSGSVNVALAHIKKAIELNGRTPDYLDTRGMVYLIGGETQRAIDDLENARELRPSSAAILFHLAQAYLQADRKADAKSTWKAAKDNGFKTSDLHDLEQANYQKVRSELEAP